MKIFRVEYNPEGFYNGVGIWDNLDILCEIEAENAQEAIEFAKTWMIENSDNAKDAEKEIANYAWRVAENKYDENGYPKAYEWKFED